MASAITYHPPLAPTEIQRQIPSVGAVCGKVARTALCGGREVTCVPTATAWYKACVSKKLSWRRAHATSANTQVGARGHGALTNRWRMCRIHGMRAFAHPTPHLIHPPYRESSPCTGV